MPSKIVVPELGESVLEATVGRWLKKVGEPVGVGEPLVELETEKVDLEVGAEKGGILSRIEKQQGEDVKIGDVLGIIEEAAGATASSRPAVQESAGSGPKLGESRLGVRESKPEPKVEPTPDRTPPPADTAEVGATPSARRLARERGVDLEEVPARGKGGRVTAEDVESYAAEKGSVTPAAVPAVKPAEAGPKLGSIALGGGRIGESEAAGGAPAVEAPRLEERVRMSRRRQTIARRLVEAQHTAAMLTTFNEVDMSAVIEIRKRWKESFKQRHGVGLGIVSFFAKASIGALREFPELNAELQDDEVVLKRYYDLGIAVGASGGLVVPVLRDADRLSFAEIERAIKGFAEKAESGTLTLEELRGGTFTITNGGVFGSLMSTPILNPPQVGILGLHKIQERPVSLQGQIASRPMMYVALSYDHRVVDGREAVQFLVRVKELVEDPASLLLEA
ncbi:MAG TPA: 2-oxoglutarate dehydrogenase complex dihydrolipoyllysine-residue succinyltransferase [Terriglobia bacterium]|nr:2-oxoglutarate dehydrogenase complex dihydrolipoyllysine-residue succinyltransferase [Terriglobia bacterium]